MTFPDLDIGPRLDQPISPTLQQRYPGLAASATRQHAIPADQPAEINGVRTVNFSPGLGPDKIYESRIYGFRVSERSRVGPRMRWLRMKPADIRELDELAQVEAMRENAEVEGEGEDNEEDSDTDMQAAPPSTMEGRKKAPIRRRRFNGGQAR